MRLSHVTIVLFAALAAAQTIQPKPPPEVPYIPTAEAVVDGMLKLAGVKSTDLVYDLGCGDGRIVIAAAKNYGAHGVGIDIDPERIRDARANARKAGVEKLVRFDEKDLFDADIRGATVVAIYLMPNVNMRLRPKLLKELKPGSRVVSHSFDMEDWHPDKEEVVDLRHIFLWTIPAKK
jgi:cyclopropane fatty-acyl-phospholipid synthase-like methyltransferase